jgi:3-isopropylmalate/(R)-2-methylmalate dehydratase large subunit
VGQGRALLGDAATDEGAHFDKSSRLDAAKLPPIVTWGTNARRTSSRSPASCPIPARFAIEPSATAQRALDYMGLAGGTKITDIKLDRVFIGSCTNGRIEDLRAAAEVAEGKKVSRHVSAMVVPGSGLVKEQAEAEGLDKIFKEAGFEWREPGCSMCLAMNPTSCPRRALRLDLEPQLRRPSGLQGPHASRVAAMAAAAAITGKLTDVRDL